MQTNKHTADIVDDTKKSTRREMFKIFNVLPWLLLVLVLVAIIVKNNMVTPVTPVTPKVSNVITNTPTIAPTNSILAPTNLPIEEIVHTGLFDNVLPVISLAPKEIKSESPEVLPEVHTTKVYQINNPDLVLVDLKDLKEIVLQLSDLKNVYTGDKNSVETNVESSVETVETISPDIKIIKKDLKKIVSQLSDLKTVYTNNEQNIKSPVVPEVPKVLDEVKIIKRDGRHVYTVADVMFSRSIKYDVEKSILDKLDVSIYDAIYDWDGGNRDELIRRLDESISEVIINGFDGFETYNNIKGDRGEK